MSLFLLACMIILPFFLGIWYAVSGFSPEVSASPYQVLAGARKTRLNDVFARQKVPLFAALPVSCDGTG
jgi:hypothetical protein